MAGTIKLDSKAQKIIYKMRFVVTNLKMTPHEIHPCPALDQSRNFVNNAGWLPGQATESGQELSGATTIRRRSHFSHVEHGWTGCDRHGGEPWDRFAAVQTIPRSRRAGCNLFPGQALRSAVSKRCGPIPARANDSSGLRSAQCRTGRSVRFRDGFKIRADRRVDQQCRWLALARNRRRAARVSQLDHREQPAGAAALQHRCISAHEGAGSRRIDHQYFERLRHRVPAHRRVSSPTVLRKRD